MNCFVASAFNKKDVDAIYDRAICPVLSEFKIRPLRVDRVEHNEDIDDLICKLINQSQLCIADLTYARPSVYYEAGFTFGSGKPVIYIGRRDHLHAQGSDPPGNLRVRFDLQMKNIITWTEPNEAFRNRLRNRLRYIIRPLLREQQSIGLQVNQSRRFSLLSQDERLKALLKKATDFLRAHSYQLCELSRKGPWARYYDHVNLQKVFHDTLYRVFVLIRPFVNKLSFQGFEGGLPLWLFTSLTKEELHKLKNIESVWIVVSLRNVRAATLPTILPDWKPITDYIFKKDKVKDLQEEVPHSATVAVLDAVRSVEDFSDRFRSLIVEIEKETS